MPTVRSPKPSRKGESDDASTTDWSLYTPTESCSAATTSTKKSAPSSTSVRTRSAAAAATQDPKKMPAPKNIGGPEEVPPSTASVPATSKPAAGAAAAAAAAAAAVPAAAAAAAAPAAASKPGNIGGPEEVPPCVPAVPRRAATRSVKSSRSRFLELEAMKKLEAARSAAALAQIELEMIQCQSEEEIEDELEQERSAHIEQWVTDSASYLSANNKKQQQQEEVTRKSDIKELADALIAATVSRTSAAPAAPSKYADLPAFTGAPEEWLPFMRTYRDTAAMFTDVQNMARLRHCIHGTAKETVRRLMFAAADPEEVIAALERRFGKPDRLVLAELESIKELPRIGDSPRDICLFASRVSNAVATISALKLPQYLYSPEVGRNVIQKLSPLLRCRWLDYTARNTEDPELVKLRKFLEHEADLWSTLAPIEAASNVNKRYNAKQVHTTQSQVSDSYNKSNCLLCDNEHRLIECRRFKEATTDKKWAVVKKNRLCFKCLGQKHSRDNCRAPPCRRCGKPHHTVLHAEANHSPPARPAPRPSSQGHASPPRKEESSTERSRHRDSSMNKEDAAVKSIYAAADGKEVYLKMIPVDVYGPAGSTRVLALLDEGSTVSLLDEEVAHRIGAKGKPDLLVLETVGGKLIEKQDSQQVDIKVKGAHRRDKRILKGVRTIGNLKLAPQHVSLEVIEKCEHLKRMSELVYSKERPTLLIGQDNWELIVSRRVIKGRPNEPVASLTSLGWVLHGCCDASNMSPVKFVNHCRQPTEEANIEEMMKKHFDLESIGIQQRRPSNDADDRALKILESTTKRLPDGRFESGLLWKSDSEGLPNNYTLAHHRLKGIERKLDRDIALKEEYGKQVQHLLDSGYAEEAPSGTTPGRTFYLPHFAVVHPMKKKIRIVFDAASRYEGKSLNDALLPGPDLLQSLFGVLLRFRQGPVAVVADIKEMFLQIKIREQDRDSLRFLWRGEDRASKPREYRMTSVIFGAASSPATAIFVKNRNAEEHQASHPEAVKAIVRNHYMDDYLQSFATIEEAIDTAATVDSIHKEAGFELRQWASNEQRVLDGLQREEASPTEVAIGSNEEKTLGLRWLIKDDALAFNGGLRNAPKEIIEGNRVPTKREVTSAVMSTFDPLGLIAPLLIKGKRMLQDIWRAGTDWDEVISEEAHHQWLEYIGSLSTLQQLRIPRCLTPAAGPGQLHTFVDASETAYAAACYWRAETEVIHVALIAGKARVSPAKPVTIPRLELQAALLGARLARTVTEEIDLQVTDRYFWSDSSTVLQWLKADPRRFKPFVAHRLAEIKDLSKPHEWRWVPTRDNPADIATREVPRAFAEDSRWFVGPDFLRRPDTDWPQKTFTRVEPSGEEKKTEVVLVTTKKEESVLPKPERFSSWLRLLRATARVFQFIENCKKKHAVNAVKKQETDASWKPHRKGKQEERRVKINKKKPEERSWLPIPEELLKKAEQHIVRNSQQESFEEDIERMKKEMPLKSNSRLKKIDVQLDDQGILRLNARTAKLKYGGSATNLAILDGRHHVVRLLIDRYHRRFCHANHATVVNELRQTYWILSLRDAVKKVLHQCQWCRTRKMKPQMPPTGDLPVERLRYGSHPFTCTAVDYFGPMFVTIGRRKEKRWGALFTCLTTRAVHLELVPSLSTSSMIMALRRMSARRGTPRVIYSDNGTNFIGANHELREEIGKLKKNELIDAANQEGIRWKFIPPGAPNMGGAWERMVRTVKTALSAILNERSPPEEVLHTLLTEVEHTVNSRPLTHLSVNPEDEESLTPNHFLIGRSCGSAILGTFNEYNLIGKADWKTTQHLADHFWKRWLREYVPTLMPRKIEGKEVRQPQPGDIVIIADASLPRNTWPRGEVIACHPGPDGRTRVVDVRTSRGGILRRPTSRLIVIVSAASRPQEGVHDGAYTGGETVSDA
uniref:Polyprotein n=1 Tax=Antheraea mylitta TaxID=34739 RepID=Q2MGA5_ANTMY|nr:polyprotein [Antheraea mylitta]